MLRLNILQNSIRLIQHVYALASAFAAAFVPVFAPASAVLSAVVSVAVVVAAFAAVFVVAFIAAAASAVDFIAAGKKKIRAALRNRPPAWRLRAQGLFFFDLQEWYEGQIAVHRITMNEYERSWKKGKARRKAMANIAPASRLKLKTDTFFIPVSDHEVYFRNNVGTFRMEGEMIDRWIEKLTPMFNGEHTMADLTDGLAKPYRDRVYDIADALFQKGFVRDVAQDRPHQLTDRILHKYAAQIAFLDNLAASGAYRFQCYRQAEVLAIGSGPLFVALVSALLESGLPRFRMLITNSAPTERERIAELARHAHKTDAEVAVEELVLQETEEAGNTGEGVWQEMVQPFQAILYVSQEGNVEELRMLQEVCRLEKKLLIPALFLHQVGIAGPLIYPESEGSWDSAWRRIHRPAVFKNPEWHTYSSTAGAMLANVIVFELFKTVTQLSEVSEPQRGNAFFQLDLETLEGDWHSFLPHPLVRGWTGARPERIQDLDHRLHRSTGKSASHELLPYISQLTSAQTGILHLWEEGDLIQLPLSQCRVQAVDPLSEGPANLLPDIVCAGLNHQEARREAGLAGLEAYVAQLAGTLLNGKEIYGIGVGETAAEGVTRGLQACLAEHLAQQQLTGTPQIKHVRLSRVEDERCRFYLQSLTTMQGPPIIGMGEKIFGFPVIWVGTGDGWHGSVGLNKTLALHKALQSALQKAQNPAAGSGQAGRTIEASSVASDNTATLDLIIPASEAISESDVLQNARQVLGRNSRQLVVVDLAVEPFLKKPLEGVFGVLLREGEFH